MGKPKHPNSKQSHFKSSKSEGGGFADARKKKAINSYKKLLRKEKRDSTLHEVIKRQKDKKFGLKVDSYAKVNKDAEAKREKIETERELRKQEREARAKQIEEVKAESAERRKKRQKLFGKKTRKGQPNLNNHMTLLLEKIESNSKKEAAHKSSNPGGS